MTDRESLKRKQNWNTPLYLQDLWDSWQEKLEIGNELTYSHDVLTIYNNIYIGIPTTVQAVFEQFKQGERRKQKSI